MRGRAHSSTTAGANSIDGKPERFGGLGVPADAGPGGGGGGACAAACAIIGFVGGHVASNVRGIYLPDERFRPIFEAAMDLDVPLFVHPADPAGKDRTRDYELTVVAGYLFDSTINIFRMICSAISSTASRA